MTPNEIDEKVKKLKDEFETLYKETEKDIILEHKILKDCLNNQVELQLHYERLKARADYYEKEAEATKDQYHSYAYGQVMKSSQKLMTGTDAKKFADCDKDYIAAVKVYNKTYKVRKEIDAVLNTVTARQYILKHVAETVMAGASTHIL